MQYIYIHIRWRQIGEEETRGERGLDVFVATGAVVFEEEEWAQTRRREG